MPLEKAAMLKQWVVVQHKISSSSEVNPRSLVIGQRRKGQHSRWAAFHLETSKKVSQNSKHSQTPQNNPYPLGNVLDISPKL